MMLIVEFAARVAPARNFDQRWRTIGSGWQVKLFEPGIAVGMQEPTAGAEECLGMDATPIW